MIVTPHRYFSTEDSQAITALLKQRRGRATSQIICLEFPLPQVDPLLALQTLLTKSQAYFYWEQGERAIAMIGSAAAWNFTGDQRFTEAQHYLQTVSELVEDDAQMLRPIVYCRFPFFAIPLAPDTPFASSHLCLPQWQIERRGEQTTLLVNVPTTRSLEVAGQEIATVLDRLERLAGQTLAPIFSRPHRLSVTGQDGLTNSIALALASINESHIPIQKIVLAHTAAVTANQDFSITRSLANLRDQHPHCYTFATGDGLGNCFLGASPERLVTVRDGSLIADALAGSAPRGRSPLLDRQFGQQLLIDPKEQHEHRLVRDFIAAALVDLGLHPYWSATPRLLQLANIQHLWTPIRTVLPPAISPLAVVEALHPTPAVAGLPREAACAKIREYEPVDRALYAAPLGWIDLDGNCEFVVGIRSALVTGDRARLYAGAGIVAGSQVQNEVAEIQLKFQPLCRALSV